MLGRNNRLQRKDFDYLFSSENKKKLVKKNFDFGTVYLLLGQDSFKMGLILSKKVCNKSTQRSKIRRFYYLAARQSGFLEQKQYLVIKLSTMPKDIAEVLNNLNKIKISS